jgi:hypothetical protein
MAKGNYEVLMPQQEGRILDAISTTPEMSTSFTKNSFLQMCGIDFWDPIFFHHV